MATSLPDDDRDDDRCQSADDRDDDDDDDDEEVRCYARTESMIEQQQRQGRPR